MISSILLAAFLSGLLGSGHCAAMCGPIIGLFESRSGATNGLSNVARRTFYQTGRLGFYALLGLLSGLVSAGLTLPLGVDRATLVLRIAAALILILLGLRLALGLQVLSFADRAGSVIWKKLSPLARHVLPMSTAPRALGAGFIWGALPCGLVYSALALAATAGGPLASALVMAAFWAGTLPVLAGSASVLAGLISRPHFRKLAGWSMVCLGIVSAVLLLPMGSTAGDHHQHHSLLRSSQNFAFGMPSLTGSNVYLATPALRCAS